MLFGGCMVLFVVWFVVVCCLMSAVCYCLFFVC